jgi:hypothetical protein
MSSPKEKARDLVDRIQEGLWRDRAVKIYQEDAIYAALIAVDEILKSVPKQPSISITMPHFEATVYWEEVKSELENL